MSGKIIATLVVAVLRVRFTGLIVVFHGWEMVFCDAVTE